MESINDFCEKLGSTSPTPGGGAAAALVLSMGASCAEKSARFSIDEHLEHYLLSFIEIRDRGFLLSQKDMQAFSNWMDARKLPKSTEDERIERDKKIEIYVKECASVPLEIAKEALHLTEIIQDFIPYCNKWLISDLAVGLSFAKASFDSSLFNIKINIPYIKDKEYVIQLENFINENEKYFHKMSRNSLRMCDKKLKN